MCQFDTSSFVFHIHMLLSFKLFAILVIAMFIISLTDKDKTGHEIPAPFMRASRNLP